MAKADLCHAYPKIESEVRAALSMRSPVPIDLRENRAINARNHTHGQADPAPRFKLLNTYKEAHDRQSYAVQFATAPDAHCITFLFQRSKPARRTIVVVS